MKCGHEDLFSGFVLLVIVQTVVSMVIPNATHLEAILEKYMDKDEAWWQSKPRGKRAISQSDMQLILDLHNKLRGQVYPPASNMEYMVRSHDLSQSQSCWIMFLNYTALSCSDIFLLQNDFYLPYRPCKLSTLSFCLNDILSKTLKT